MLERRFIRCPVVVGALLLLVLMYLKQEARCRSFAVTNMQPEKHVEVEDFSSANESTLFSPFYTDQPDISSPTTTAIQGEH